MAQDISSDKCTSSSKSLHHHCQHILGIFSNVDFQAHEAGVSHTYKFSKCVLKFVLKHSVLHKYIDTDERWYPIENYTRSVKTHTKVFLFKFIHSRLLAVRPLHCSKCCFFFAIPCSVVCLTSRKLLPKFLDDEFPTTSSVIPPPETCRFSSDQ